MVKSTVIFFIVLFFSVTALAMEFSADSIMTHGKEKMTSKIFYKPDKFRIEMNAPQQMITINRVDKKVIWNIMPEEKMYMEMPFQMQNKPKVDEKVEGEIDRKLISNETVDGHPTKKYLITYKADGKNEQMYQWWATDINFVVKTAAVDGSWTQEFRNIKIGSQPDNLFEVPAGYRKMQMPVMDFKKR
jgi:hypothetical protein